MNKEDQAKFVELFREYLKIYVEDNEDVTDKAREMYIQVFNWIVLNKV